MTINRPHAERVSKNVCISMHDEMIEDLDAIAAKEDVSRSEIVRRANDDYIAKYGIKKKKLRGWATENGSKT